MSRQMKDSGIEWLGVIGSGFEVYKVKHVFEILDQFRSPIAADARNQDAEVLYDYYGASGAIDKIDGYTIDDHVMLIGEDGANLRMRNLPLVYEVKGKAWVNNHAHILKPKKGLDFRFLFFAMESLDINPYITGSAQPKLSQDNLKNIYVPVPQYLVQKYISGFLDAQCAHIDSVIKKTKVSIEAYKQLKQSIITQAVTKGVRGDRPMKDSGIEWIGQIPSEWEVKRTKYIAKSMTKGSGITKNDVVEDGDIQCIRYGEIYSKYEGDFVETFSRTNENSISSAKHISKGDILFTCTGELIDEIGKNVVYMGDKPCLVGGDIIVMQHEQNPIFLNYALNSSYSQAQKSFGKTKLKVVHISAGEIGNTLIALPPINEQIEIANYLDKKSVIINQIIDAKEKSLEEFKSYKKSLIYEYVTGKKEVPNS